MALTLPDKWIWDSWYVRDGDLWHGFFLQADKALGDPELRHFNVTHGHATSHDLTTWQYHGTSFHPAPAPAWDDYTTWTGSVIRSDGLWHMFYTGTNRAEQGLKQRIGHATSHDLQNWTRVGDGLAVDLAGDLYEEHTPARWFDRALRDPWVMRDPAGNGWLMYFTARVPGLDESNAGGAVGLATSPDLQTWILQPPVFAGAFGQMEVPQVFEVRGRWYCLFCTIAEHWSEAYAAGYPGIPVSGTHYMVADDPRGPWAIAPGPFLDGQLPCHRYAARLVETDTGLALLAFLHSPGGGPFVGAIADPAPLTIDEEGWLRLR